MPNWVYNTLTIQGPKSEIDYIKDRLNSPFTLAQETYGMGDINAHGFPTKIKDFNSKTSLYDTGIKIEVEEGYYTEIVPRSSISKFGYILANNVGIIDNNYRGNLMIALTKICDDAADIQLPFKCCQLIIRKQIFPNIYELEVNDLSSTQRNEGGFGSTS